MDTGCRGLKGDAWLESWRRRLKKLDPRAGRMMLIVECCGGGGGGVCVFCSGIPVLVERPAAGCVMVAAAADVPRPLFISWKGKDASLVHFPG